MRFADNLRKIVVDNPQEEQDLISTVWALLDHNPEPQSVDMALSLLNFWEENIGIVNEDIQNVLTNLKILKRKL